MNSCREFVILTAPKNLHMKFYWPPKKNLVLAITVALLSFSCEKISQFAQETLQKNSGQTAGSARQAFLQNKDKTLEKQSSHQPSAPGVADDIEIIVTKDSNQIETVKSAELKEAVAVQFKVEAPVHVRKRVGGAGHFISAAGKYICVDFPQHFAVYDSNLNLLAVNPVKFPLKKVQSFVKNEKTYFYLKEENDVFEIYELKLSVKEDKTVHELVEVQSIEMEGDYEWINADLVAVFSDSKIQFRDFSNFENVTIVGESPISGIHSVWANAKRLYISRHRFLDVMDLENFNISATINIGRDFRILGIADPANQPKLVLAHTDEDDRIHGFQLLSLNKEGNAVSGLGDTIPFPVVLKNVTVNLEQMLVAGEQADETSSTTVNMFSLKEKRLLRGNLETFTNLQAWSFDRSNLYLINDREITVNEIQLNQDVIRQSEPIQKILSQKTQTPLAQIGAEKIVRDEYLLTAIRRLDFMADTRKVALLSENHAIILENTADGKAHRIFTSANFGETNFTLQEPSVPQPDKYDELLATPLGLFAYSRATETVYFMDIELNKMQILPVPVHDMAAWAHFTSNGAEILVISSRTRSQTPGTAPDHDITFYLLNSPADIKPLLTLTRPQKTFVFYVPEGQVVLLSEKAMELYRWDDGSGAGDSPNKVAEKAKKYSLAPIETVELPPAGRNFHSAKISPRHDALYIYFTEQQLGKIFVMNIFDVNDNAVLSDFEITPDQFRGSAFSKGGRLFILPSTEGTLFYDVTYVQAIREVAHWPLPSHYADVAAQGNFICVALGHKGVYCGDLLF